MLQYFNLQILFCRSALFRLTSTPTGEETPEKPRNWRSHCATLLLDDVRHTNTWKMKYIVFEFALFRLQLWMTHAFSFLLVYPGRPFFL